MSERQSSGAVPTISTATSPADSTSPAATRPRLAAALLARNNGSQNTEEKPSADVAAALEGLTLEPKPSSPEDKAPRGYKNVPSLDQLTERMRAKSNAGDREREKENKVTADDVEKVPPSAELEEGEVADDGSEPKEAPHPLQHIWQV
jgi:translation initiation factor 4E